MKKIIMTLLLVLLGAMASYAFLDSYVIDRDKLPADAQQFLKDYFPKARISLIKIDRHLLKKPDYEVRLTNGTTIEFKNSGQWKEVDCKDKAVPDGIVPKRIKQYVTKNYPDVKITKIEKKSGGYEIELGDNIELKFDLLGTFKSVKMDD